MPSKSKTQTKLMQAVAHGWKPKGAKAPQVPKDVAMEYVRADKKKR